MAVWRHIHYLHIRVSGMIREKGIADLPNEQMHDPAHGYYPILLRRQDGEWLLSRVHQVKSTARNMEHEGAEDCPSATVVLIHGLGRSALCWRSLRKAMEQRGFETVVVGYPSTRLSIPDLVSKCAGPALSGALQRASARGVTVHVVTRSMGGILLRYWLQTNCLPPGSRVVMLAPPNRGGGAIDRLARFA